MLDYIRNSTTADSSETVVKEASSMVVASASRIVNDLAITARELGRLEAFAWVREQDQRATIAEA